MSEESPLEILEKRAEQILVNFIEGRGDYDREVVTLAKEIVMQKYKAEIAKNKAEAAKGNVEYLGYLAQAIKRADNLGKKKS